MGQFCHEQYVLRHAIFHYAAGLVPGTYVPGNPLYFRIFLASLGENGRDIGGAPVVELCKENGLCTQQEIAIPCDVTRVAEFPPDTSEKRITDFFVAQDHSQHTVIAFRVVDREWFRRS